MGDPESAALSRRNLDRQFCEIRLHAFTKPPAGWVRTVREALGLTTRQLAKRMHKAQPGITALEKNETTESITLKSLREAAAALDCQLVYALVPNDSLEATVRRQARKAAEYRLRRLNHSIETSNRDLQDAERVAELERLTEKFLQSRGGRLWDDP